MEQLVTRPPEAASAQPRAERTLFEIKHPVLARMRKNVGNLISSALMLNGVQAMPIQPLSVALQEGHLARPHISAFASQPQPAASAGEGESKSSIASTYASRINTRHFNPGETIRVKVVMLNEKGEMPIDPAKVHDVMEGPTAADGELSVEEFYKKVVGINIITSYYGPYNTENPETDHFNRCDMRQENYDDLSFAQQRNIPIEPGQIVLFVQSRLSDCDYTWDGFARPAATIKTNTNRITDQRTAITGPTFGTAVLNGSYWRHSYKHEIGHDEGLWHAQSATSTCVQALTYTADCQTDYDSYGDKGSEMGSGEDVITPVDKLNFNKPLITMNQVQVAKTSGNYRVANSTGNNEGTQIITIAKPDKDPLYHFIDGRHDSWWVSYSYIDQNVGGKPGVDIRLYSGVKEGPYASNQTDLFATLREGQTFTDKANHETITFKTKTVNLLDLTKSTAVISVHVPPKQPQYNNPQ